MASTNRILKLLYTPIKIRSDKNAIIPDRFEGHIKFTDVDFGYEENLILKKISLNINKGKYIGLVGTTGAGKSFLIKLLLRLYDPINGSVEVDGVELKRLDLHSLRNALGFVSQDPFLFDGTIFENITYGFEDGVSESRLKEKVTEATKLAEIDDFITQLPQGYNTRVGERGLKLSGGQRQRICIARALLKDPKILIFDEATSAVDNETEASIQRSLLKLKHSRTMIVIAHRLSTVRFADKIYVMADKGIAEKGTHSQLLSQKGIYANLWSIQTGDVSI